MVTDLDEVPLAGAVTVRHLEVHVGEGEVEGFALVHRHGVDALRVVRVRVRVVGRDEHPGVGCERAAAPVTR